MERQRKSVKIETQGYRWVAIRLKQSLPHVRFEFIVADDLAGDGLNSYCPLAQSFAIWESHYKRARKGTIRQKPVFCRYIFCGLLDNQRVGKDTRRHIESVLSVDAKPLEIPSPVIAQINAWELAGQWDETTRSLDKLPFSVGDMVRFTEGPFQTFPATVEAIESEARIKTLVRMFGRATAVYASYGQIARI